jgi:hypothetical protein
VKRLVGIHNIFEQAHRRVAEGFRISRHAEEIAEKPGAVKLERFSERIRFENVLSAIPSPNGFPLRARSGR